MCVTSSKQSHFDRLNIETLLMTNNFLVKAVKELSLGFAESRTNVKFIEFIAL